MRTTGMARLAAVLFLLAEFATVAVSGGESDASPDGIRRASWNYEGDAFPVGWLGARVQADDAMRTPAGDRPLRVETPHDFDELEWPPILVYPHAGDLLLPGGKVEIRCWAKASRPLKTFWRVTRGAPNSDHLSPTIHFELTPEWREIVFETSLYGVNPPPVVNTPRMVFPDLRKADRVWLGPLTSVCRSQPGEAAAPLPETTAAIDVEQPGNWKPISTRSLYVKPGSALDFTDIVDRAPAGAWGRLIADPATGAAVFEKRPNVPVRFLSVQCSPGQILSYSREDIDQYAAAAARQGYNLVRLHYLDEALQGTARAARLKQRQDSRHTLPERAEDIDFDPVALDRFHYLVAAFKKNGIYLNLDAMSSYIGFDGGRNARGDPRGTWHTKTQLFVNPMFRNNWKAGVGKLFRTVNPHTGLSLNDDPAVVLVCFLNEQEILSELRDYSAAFKPAWTAFLKNKYGTYAALHKAWDGRCGDENIPSAAGGDFDALPGIVNKIARGTSPAGKDMTECIGAMEKEMSEFYLAAIREIGYPGLVTNWNMRTRMASIPARSVLPAVSMNAYHAHPENGYTDNGSVVDPRSSIALAGNSLKNQAVARFTDRPFFNTEFNHSFWNPFRHEQGLLFGAGAALQGWTAITCHGMQVRDGGTWLVPFDAGSDPVIRAAEAVEALAYLRGDVATSPHLVEIPLDDRYIFDGRALRGLSDELSRLWALCRVGIVYGPRQATAKPDLVVFPGQTVELGGTLMYTRVENSVTTAEIAPVVAKLRQRGVLSKDNPTDATRGLFRSDTGEVTLDTRDGGLLTVVTPRLVGATVKNDRPLKLGPVTVKGCTVPAAVTVASLNKETPIAESGRLLVVFATDALNNGMRFRDSDRRVLKGLGTLPVLWRTGKLSLSIASKKLSTDTRLYSLALDGGRLDELPVRIEDGRAFINIDTNALPSGPSVYFELAPP